MQKTTKKEWTAMCRDCTWCGKRRSDQKSAQQEVNNHLKTHPKHKVRVMVTGENSAAVAETERIRVEEAWKDIAKHKTPSKIKI